MKKILFIMAMILPMFVFMGCSDDDDEGSKTQTVLVNVSCQYEGLDSKKLASPTLVLLYDYEIAKNFDKEKSVDTMYSSQKISLTDGTILKPKYTSDNFTGVNTFEDVENGQYLIIAYFKPEGYSWPMFYYYGYKQIVVNEDNAAQLYNLVFTWGEDGKFVSL